MKKKKTSSSTSKKAKDLLQKKETKSKPSTKKTTSTKKTLTTKTTSRQQPKTKSTKKKKTFLKKLLIVLISLGILVVFAAMAFLIYIVVSTAKFDPEALKSKDQTVVYDINNEVIATLGSEKRESVTYDKLPQVLVDAIIATEDSRFFEHNGVDSARFLKATFGHLGGNSSAGGASTLTMQVVKNNLTSTERSIIRKFKDMYLSVFYLEKKYTKEEIIELYVNDSLLGGSVFGVGEAAEYYFGKSVSELSLPEASLLAGMFQSPNGYNPYKYPEKAEKRRQTVLNLMVRHGYITKEEANIAASIPVESLLVDKKEEVDYQGYIDTVVSEVEKETDQNPYVVPMKIYTTMEKSIQDGINNVLSGNVVTWENDAVQSGIAVVNAETGAIAAVGAGRNREGKSTYNYATQSKRQPGSTAKPLFDYGPGFEYNNFSTYTLFNDEPWSYTGGNQVGNWDGSYMGLITLRTALAQSRNIPALKAFQQVSKKNINTFVTSLGIEPEYENNVLTENHAIGGFTGVSPLQMAAAYSAFASMGYYTDPYSVTKIEYRSTGEVKEFKHEKTKVMSDSTAYLMNNVLEYATNYGFSGGAKVAGSHVATKTGTSNFDEATLKAKGLPYNAVNDLWTVSYTSKYSVALWYGYDPATKEHYNTNNSPKGTIMAAVMSYIPKDTTGWTMPSSVVSATVENGTWPAKLASEYTPADLILTEYFKKGTQPTEVSERFSQLDNVTNLKASTGRNSITLSWKYTTPKILDQSYLKEYFSQSVFGNGSTAQLNARLAYNQNTLGGQGFGIYVKTSSGDMTRVAYTTDTTYTLNTSNFDDKNLTIIVKAEYANYKANASSGTQVSGTTNNTEEKTNVNVTVPSNYTTSPGSYTESGLKVTANGKDVTDDCEITYTVVGRNSFTSSSELESYMNKLEVGDYTIKYTIIYNGKTYSKNKNVTIE